jgi:hypothetical protein
MLESVRVAGVREAGRDALDQPHLPPNFPKKERPRIADDDSRVKVSLHAAMAEGVEFELGGNAEPNPMSSTFNHAGE